MDEFVSGSTKAIPLISIPFAAPWDLPVNVFTLLFLFTIERKANPWTLRLFATPHAR